MAKIDTAGIQGYAEMTPEQKIAALEGYEYDDNSAELNRLKGALTKASGEAAKWKREHNAHLSDEEKAKQETDQRIQDMEAELKALREEKTIAAYKAKYLAQGYDEALAAESAEALAKGDTDKVFANQEKFMKAYGKNLRSEALRSTPRPPAGEGNSAMTKDDIMKIRDVSERQAAIAANLDLFGKD